MPKDDFYVIVKTDTEFSLHGPVADDTNWTNKVYEAQQRGKDVRCEAFSVNKDTEATVIARVTRELGLQHTTKNLLA